MNFDLTIFHEFKALLHVIFSARTFERWNGIRPKQKNVIKIPAFAAVEKQSYVIVIGQIGLSHADSSFF